MIDWISDFRALLETDFGTACPQVLQANGGGGIYRESQVLRQAIDGVARPYGIIGLGQMNSDPSGKGDTAFIVTPTLTLVYADPENEATLLAALGNLRRHFDDILEYPNGYERMLTMTLRPPDADPWNGIAARERAQAVCASMVTTWICDEG